MPGGNLLTAGDADDAAATLSLSLPQQALPVRTCCDRFSGCNELGDQLLSRHQLLSLFTAVKQQVASAAQVTDTLQP